ncbi:MAG: ParB N-terminal domain-containing protein [bacterium]|nr:ParB N-terminal domain-containing protein [bacterium]
MKMTDIKENPDNPRIIKDDKFKKLVKSLKKFPKMMELRPIVIDNNNMVLAGNMRLKALKELKFTILQDNWIKKASDLTEKEKKEFILKDNLSYGDWDKSKLKNDYEFDDLLDLDLDLDFDLELDEEIETEDIKAYKVAHILISYPPNIHNDIIDIIEKLQIKEGVEIEQSAN